MEFNSDFMEFNFVFTEFYFVFINQEDLLVESIGIV